MRSLAERLHDVLRAERGMSHGDILDVIELRWHRARNPSAKARLDALAGAYVELVNEMGGVPW